jgi:hypothetical protein
MRINLVTPFAEKDDAKKLGAKWDSQRKCWYIVDVADLTPFMRWIPDVTAASAESALDSPAITIATNLTAVPTKVKKAVPHCGCDVKPWDDCEHTLAPT